MGVRFSRGNKVVPPADLLKPPMSNGVLQKDPKVGNFISVFDENPKSHISNDVILEHYMPYEFPLCPVITSLTQELVVQSWKRIIGSEYDSPDTVSGKISGASYFYTKFFERLFERLGDFERIFPSIHSRANIISHVMGMCVSVRVEDLKFLRVRLHSLGHKHIHIVHDPWQFAIYVTTIHSTVRFCLADDATPEIMNAWLHLLSWVLRTMLPVYFGDFSKYERFYEGAVNSASVVSTKAQLEIKQASEVKEARSELLSGGIRPVAVRSRGSPQIQQFEKSEVGKDGLTAFQRTQLENTKGENALDLTIQRAE